MSTEIDPDDYLSDLNLDDIQPEDPAQPATEAEMDVILAGLDDLKNIVVDDAEPPELVRVRSDLIAHLDEALALAQQIGNSCVVLDILRARAHADLSPKWPQSPGS